ncbi:MAG: hypothetical protein AB7N91_09785 [Candidatus Tectimicrobiota bacterium]
MAEESEALKQEAARYGLTNLTEQHLAQFANARAAAARYVQSVARDLPVSVEPAHVFRAGKEA